MTHNICFVLALCVGQVAGGSTSPYNPLYVQPGNAPVATQPTMAPTNAPTVSEPVIYAPAKSNVGPLRSWFQHTFGKQPTATGYQYQVKDSWKNPGPSYANVPVTTAPSQPVVTEALVTPSNAPAQLAPMPVGTSAAISPYEESEPPIGVQQFQPGQQLQQGQAPTTPLLSGLQVDKKYEPKVGHEQDYSWVTGHLFYVHADGGKWVVRYAMPGEVDKYGGSIVLAPGVEMKNYREGDLVCVYGEILDEGRTSQSLGGALYRVNSIMMIERGEQ